MVRVLYSRGCFNAVPWSASLQVSHSLQALLCSSCVIVCRVTHYVGDTSNAAGRGLTTDRPTNRNKRGFGRRVQLSRVEINDVL